MDSCSFRSESLAIEAAGDINITCDFRLSKKNDILDDPTLQLLSNSSINIEGIVSSYNLNYTDNCRWNKH